MTKVGSASRLIIDSQLLTRSGQVTRSDAFEFLILQDSDPLSRMRKKVFQFGIFSSDEVSRSELSFFHVAWTKYRISKSKHSQLCNFQNSLV